MHQNMEDRRSRIIKLIEQYDQEYARRVAAPCRECPDFPCIYINIDDPVVAENKKVGEYIDSVSKALIEEMERDGQKYCEKQEIMSSAAADNLIYGFSAIEINERNGKVRKLTTKEFESITELNKGAGI